MKRFGKILLALMLAIVSISFTVPVMSLSAAEADVDLTDGLIGYWNFDEDKQTTVVNQVTGKSEYNGVLVGNGVSIKESKFGNALHFDASLDSYMEVPRLINTGTSDFSFSLWYSYDDSMYQSNANTVLLQQNGSGRTILFLTKDKKYGSYVNAQNVYSQQTVSNDVWQHITISYNASAKKIKYYINGTFDSESDAGAASVDALTSLYIGCHKNKGSDPHSMKGDIDELRYYNKVLNDQEARAVFEDKGAFIIKETLTHLIQEAQQVYDSGKVAQGEAEAIALKEMIAEAKQLSENDQATASELNGAIDDLTQAISKYNSAMKATLNIDTSKIIRTIDSATFGINHRYAFNGYGSYDEANGEIRKEFQKLYQEAGFGSIRYPGGTISNLFQWKSSLGDQAERVKQIHGFYNNANQHGIAPNFGISEIGDFAQENNSEIVYVYGMGRGSAKDASDLVEFLNAEVGTNPNGGIDWASIRAENGHPRPYNVRYFEIGNEMYQGGTDGNTSQMYWLSGTGAPENSYIKGGTASFTRQYAVAKDDWNVTASKSNGAINQKFYMRYANPVDEDDPDFVAVNQDSVHVYVNQEEYKIVDDITNAKATDKVVEIDWQEGGIQFGDGTHGMIPETGAQVTVDYSVKREGFVDISKAMRDTMNTINEKEGKDSELHVYSSWETQGFVTKMHEQGYDAYYDGLTIHPYSGTPDGGSSSESAKNTFYEDAMLKGDKQVAHVASYVEQMKQYDDTKVPVISEYGIFRSTDTLLRSQTHALYIARQIMEYTRLGSPYIQKHCLVDWYSSGADALGPTQQAVIQAAPMEGADPSQGTGDYRFFATPSARVFEMLSNSFGTQLVESSFDTMPTLSNGAEMYSSFASIDQEGNLYVGLVNLDVNSAKKIQLNVQDYDLMDCNVNVQVLSGESFDDENDFDHPDHVKIEKETYKNEDSHPVLTMRPHSFTIYSFTKGKMSVDKTALQAKVDEVKDYEEKNHTKDSWAVFAQALAQAETMLQNEDATATQVNEALSALTEAADKLVQAEDTSLMKQILKNVITKAETLINNEAFDKLAPNVQAMINVRLQEAQAAYANETATNAECLQAWKNLSDALQYADFKADKTMLKALIEECDAIDLDQYEEGVDALKAALNTAKKVYEDDNVLQKTIDEAYDALHNAKNGLKEKPVITVDKSALSSIIESVRDAADHKDDYAQNDAWTAFENAFAKAEAVLADEQATQEEVDQATRELASAYDDIRLAPSEELLKQLKDFINITATITRALFDETELQIIDQAAEKAQAMIDDQTVTRDEVIKFSDTMAEVIQLIEGKSVVVPGDEDNKSNDIEYGKETDKASAKTFDSTNVAGLYVVMISGAAVVALIRKQRRT